MPSRTTLYLLTLFVVYTQQLKSQASNSLLDMSFDELYIQSKTLFSEKNTQKALLYFEAYKQKAIKERNNEKLINGYRSMANWQTTLDNKIAYADSAISVAQKTNNNELIGNALYTKGVAYFTNNHWNKTLEYYLLADSYINKSNNKYSENKIKYGIFQAKYTLGHYDEALNVIQECIAYFKQFDDNNHRKGYLSSLHSYGICLNRMGKYKECSDVNKKGLEKVKEFGINEMEYSFISSEGINQYSLGNYQQALKLLEESLPFFISSRNTKQQTVIEFFIGKSYIDLHKNEQAITQFKKVDSLFTATNYLRNDMAENYVFLIDDAKKNHDLEKELHYTNRLLQADELLHNQYKDVAVTIHKKYDTKKLEESKSTIEGLLKQKTARNKWLLVFLSVALLCIITLLIRYIHYRKKFQKLYKQFIENQSIEKQPIALVADSEIVVAYQHPIKEEVVQKILVKLERFENNKGFVKQNLTLSKLAESLKTNSKYLTKIILEHKQKEYSQYINDLRINHLMELLKSKKHLEYTIEALAGEIGFSSAKGFNIVFYKTTGMKFSNFLNEFRKEKTHPNLYEVESRSYSLTEV